jgi:UDP-2,3-diacylglucosamine pyrophosphatase LpxH
MGNSNAVAVCISDFHIGENLGGVSGKVDVNSVEFYKNIAENVYVRKEFLTLLSKLDEQFGVKNGDNKIKYLIIMGDNWDLAVQPMEYSFDLSLRFFSSIGLEKYFDEIIYIPGNHDHHIWRMLQSYKCVQAPLKNIFENVQKRDPTSNKIIPYPQVIPGYLDLTTANFTMGGDPIFSGPSDIVSGLTGSAHIPVTTVYPNLYLFYEDIDKNRKTIMATHGHLFDGDWLLVTDYLGFIFETMGETMNLKDIEKLNSTVTEFWNYQWSQMGRYDLVDKLYDSSLQQKIYAGLMPIINKLLQELFAQIDITGLAEDLAAGLCKLIINVILKKAFSNQYYADYDIKFIDGRVEKLTDFINMSIASITKEQPSVQSISKLLFGHTHAPAATPFSNVKVGADMEIYNTGGWVNIGKYNYPAPLAISGDGKITFIDIIEPLKD